MVLQLAQGFRVERGLFLTGLGRAGCFWRRGFLRVSFRNGVVGVPLLRQQRSCAQA